MCLGYLLKCLLVVFGGYFQGLSDAVVVFCGVLIVAYDLLV